ncbi:DUF1579 family protein [Chitinophaga niabensis]|nr:DUF1579 family protein [Chitinophaga niabensis]
MNKVISATGIALALLFSTGFRGVEKAPGTLENKAIPKEKKALLNKIAGRWITQTNIHARNGQPASKVIGSDVWQWSPDGNFLLHIAYGIRDKNGFGGMEITGYNAKTGGFDSYNFNPDGSFSMGTLTIHNNTWIWNSENVRTTGVMDGDGKLLPVKHEITEDGKTYEVFMDGVLTKGSDF